ncbi:MAG: ATP-binding protein [Thermodesulfovibrionia bacterium]
MRTKLFLAFIIIISLAILSNITFERLVLKDFDDFVNGMGEDRVYWIMASIEGGFEDGSWNMNSLRESLHWALMLGFETYVEDANGKRLISSTDVLASLGPSMLKRMGTLFKLPSGVGDFTWYPLYVGGTEIGRLYIRPLERIGLIPIKEDVFRRRGKEFLLISFLIAGLGALILAVLFTIFLSNPLRRLTNSAERVARGDFSAQIPMAHKKFKDEMDKLTVAFNYMVEALRREDELRRHLTSNLYHELRTPLTIIKGNLEAIEDGILYDPNEVIRNIKMEIERIISLVQGIEDITSAEASFFKRGEKVEINLKEFIDSIIEGMRKMFEEKGLFLKQDGLPTTVKTYPEKLHIVLKNLLTNAYKFTQSGGITVRWGKDGDGFYIIVEDTGRGIPRDKIKRVFDRFYKDMDSEGMGLGLAIAKELIDVMGGRIEVESIEGKGSRFSVYLE